MTKMSRYALITALAMFLAGCVGQREPAPVEEVSSEPVQEKVEKVEVKPQEVKVAPVKAEPVQAKADVTEAKTSSKSGSNIAAATVVKPQAEAKVNPILAQAKQEKEDDQILNDMYIA